MASCGCISCSSGITSSCCDDACPDITQAISDGLNNASCGPINGDNPVIASDCVCGPNPASVSNLLITEECLDAAIADFCVVSQDTATAFAAVGCDITGNTRGDYAIDLQNFRSNATMIAGGLRSVTIGSDNLTENDFSTISGGVANSITTAATGLSTHQYQVIAGGNSNATDKSLSSTISGGQENTIGVLGTDSPFATIGGGRENSVEATGSTISGGDSNSITAAFCVIGGGVDNQVTASDGTVSGGDTNVVGGAGGTIGGGNGNSATQQYATIAGGTSNQGFGIDSTISGGNSNSVQSTGSAIGGGQSNLVQNAVWSTVGGGFTNQVTDGSNYSTIGGGQSNVIANDALFATISGGQGNLVQAPAATIAGGVGAKVINYGAIAHAAGSFATTGDAQTSVFVSRGDTIGGSQEEIFLDGVSEQFILSDNQALHFKIMFVAKSSADTAAYKIEGLIRRDAGVATTAIVGAPVKTVIAETDATWDVAVAADAATGALTLLVTGGALATVGWVARTTTVAIIGFS